MRRSAASRLATTLWVVVSLLFAQMALAQYVCPVAPAEDQTVAVMEMAPGMPCSEMDHSQGAQPALCHHHCENAAQSFEPVKVPTVSLPAVIQVLLVPLRTDPSARQAVQIAVTGEAQPPPSPVFLATLRLRV